MINGFLKKLWHDKGISLAATWSFNQLAYAIVYPFVPIYLSQERGMPYTTVSLIFPLMGLAVILAPLPCGCLTDRFGRKFMMLFGQLARGIIFFILSYCVFVNAPFWVFAALLMLNTAVGVAFQVGADAYLADITTKEERPSYFGKIRIGFNVGWAVGPMLGAFFAKTPFWLFFIITGLLCVIGTVYTNFVCFRNTVSTAASHPQESNPDEVNIVEAVFKNPRFLLLMAGTLLLMLLTSQLYSTLSVYSTQSIGISREALGSIYSLNGTLVLVLQLPIVALFKKLKTPITLQLIAGTLTYCLGYLTLIPAAAAVTIAIAVVIITLGELAVHPALYTSVSSCTNESNAGRLLSIYSLMRGIGYSAGPWIGAQLFEKFNSPLLLWGVLSLFAAASAVLFSFTGNKSIKRNNI